MSLHYHRRRHAVLSWWCREHWSVFLRLGNLLAASFFMRGHTAWRITPQDRASWGEETVLTRRGRWRSVSCSSWRKGAVLMQRRRRCSVSYIARGWRWVR